jgi:hypothetical protein
MSLSCDSSSGEVCISLETIQILSHCFMTHHIVLLLSNDVRSVDAGGLDELEEIDDVFRVDSVQHSMDADERSSSSHTITTEREGEGVRGTMVENRERHTCRGQ